MIKIMNKVKENPIRSIINTIISIGVIQFLLSIPYGYISRPISAYIMIYVITYAIPIIIVIILAILKLCNPFTMVIGNMLLLLAAFFEFIPMPMGYDALYYSLDMTVITLIIAILYYLFGYKKKTIHSNIIILIITLLIVIIWYRVYIIVLG